VGGVCLSGIVGCGLGSVQVWEWIFSEIFYTRKRNEQRLETGGDDRREGVLCLGITLLAAMSPTRRVCSTMLKEGEGVPRQGAKPSSAKHVDTTNPSRGI